MNRRTFLYLAAGAACILAAMLSRVIGDGAYFKAMVTIGCIAAAVGLIIGNRREKGREYVSVGTENRKYEVPEIGFKDVVANEEARSSLMGLVDYLVRPEKYEYCGARMPRGILLYGPPGTGKTLLARALAGEAHVPFIAMSGSDFVQMYVGVGASRIREMFKKARKAGKCVIFIDEIDALGKRRNDNASDERDQTLNALLSEMSGFCDSSGIIVVAATNRMEVLDPALLRPGRFDRCIEVGLPGKAERLEILRLHSRNKKLAPSVDMEKLADDTCTFSGAALESLLNEAALISVARDSKLIENDDMERAYLNVVAGADRKPNATGEEMCIIALHEAGHAVISKKLMPETRIKRISILPAGRSMAGYNLSIHTDKTLFVKDELEKQITVLFGGRAAELLVNGSEGLTSGASGDLAKAAEIAGIMITEFGMGSSPEISLRSLGNICTGTMRAEEEIRKTLEDSFAKAKEILIGNMDLLMYLTDKLVENEVLTEDEINRIFDEWDSRADLY